MPTLQEIRQKYPQYGDMSDEAFADAFHKKFYSDMTREDFNTRLGITQPQSPPAAEEKSTLQKIREFTGDVNRGIVNGLTFNLGDEIAGAAMAPIESAVTGKGLGEAYDTTLKAQRALDKASKERSPLASTVGEVLGGLTTGMGISNAGPTLLRLGINPTTSRMIGRAALEGGAYGAASGFGRGEGLEDRVAKAGTDALIGAGTGAAVGSVAGRMARGNRAASIPSRDALEATTDAGYSVLDNTPVHLTPQSYGRFFSDLTQEMQDRALHRTLQPHAFRAFQETADVAANPGAPTLKGLETLRKIANRSIKSTDPSDREFGMVIRQHIDDYMGRLTMNDVLPGTNNPEPVVEALGQARDAFSRMRKAEMLDDLEHLASLGPTGGAQAVQREARKISRAQTKKQTLTDAERQAIDLVSRGSALQRGLNVLGKLSPNAGFGGLTMAVGGLGAPATGGLSMLPSALGAAAKFASGRIADRNLSRASELVRTGGQNYPLFLTQPQLARLRALLTGSREVLSPEQ